MRNYKLWIAGLALSLFMTGCANTNVVDNESVVGEETVGEETVGEENVREGTVGGTGESGTGGSAYGGSSSGGASSVSSEDSGSEGSGSEGTGSEGTGSAGAGASGASSGGSASSGDSIYTDTGIAVVSGIGTDTMTCFGDVYRKLDNDYYYLDNSEHAKSCGPIAENLNEFYQLVEAAVREGKDEITIHINSFDESFGRREVQTKTFFTHNGVEYQSKANILTTTFELADFKRVCANTGKNVYWELDYQIYLRPESRYAAVNITFYYPIYKIYEFSDRAGFDAAIDQAYRDGKATAVFMLKWDQKDAAFSWHEWSETYAHTPLSKKYGCTQTFFYNERNVVAQGPATGALGLSRAPSYNTWAIWSNVNGVDSIMNELQDDGSIEPRSYCCCYTITLDIVNWNEEIAKYNVPCISNESEFITEVQKYVDSDELAYVAYAKCTQDEAFNYYTKALEYVPGNKIMYYLLADGYWIFYKQR